MNEIELKLNKISKPPSSTEDSNDFVRPYANLSNYSNSLVNGDKNMNAQIDNIGLQNRYIDEENENPINRNKDTDANKYTQLQSRNNITFENKSSKSKISEFVSENGIPSLSPEVDTDYYNFYQNFFSEALV